MTGWSQDRADLCAKLWREGLSASQIADRLGGVTRNAVISKVHRMGAASRSVKESRQNGAQEKTMAGRIRARKVPPKAKQPLRRPQSVAGARNDDLATPGPKGKRVTLLELCNTTCRWPVGSRDGAMLFCGASSDLAAGRPYCEFHAAKARSRVQLQARTKAAQRQV